MLWLLPLLALAAPPQDAVVLLVQGPGTCAGAFVDDQGTVATAYHCVTVGGRPRVTTFDGREALGRVTRVDVRQDLALVEVPDLAGSPSIPLRDGPAEVGSRVQVIGHPFGARRPVGFVEGTLRWAVSEGVLSAVGSRSLQFTAPINPGNSGGPLLDEEGQLLGVVSRALGGAGIGFAARAEGVAALLAGEGRPFSPLGGALALETFGALGPGDGGAFALGARVEVTLRDRVVLGAAWAVPVDARWTVQRFERAQRWTEFETRLGVRQRVFRGRWSSWIEAYGGVASVTALSPHPERVFERSSHLAPLAGAALGVAGTALDLALVRDEEEGWGLRLKVVLRWPGLFWMF